jgi:hypothetical protein
MRTLVVDDDALRAFALTDELESDGAGRTAITRWGNHSFIGTQRYGHRSPL